MIKTIKKTVKYLVITLQLLVHSYSFSNGVSNDNHVNTRASIKDSAIYLNYKFGKQFPYMLKISSLNNIYVSDGISLFKFNPSGQFLKRISIDKTIIGDERITDFIVTESNNQELFYICTGNTMYALNSNIQLNYQIEGGYLIRVANGVMASNFQKYIEATGAIQNGIYLYKDHKAKVYPTKIELATLSFEIVDDKIMLHADDGNFYILPIDTLYPTKSIKLNDLPNDRVWFIGMINNQYVFKINDFNKKVDLLQYYDDKFNFIRTVELNFNYEEIAKDFKMNDEFLLEFPSGIIYSYHNGKIYFMRNTEKGTFISEIDKE